MAEILVRVCDVDPIPGEVVRHYTITVDGRVTEMDLCDTHAGIFAPHRTPQEPPRMATPTQVPTPAQKSRSATPRAPKGAARRKVTTMAEIEAMKRA